LSKLRDPRAVRLTVATVAKCLRQANGNLTPVAKAFHVTRQAVQEYVARHPTLRHLISDLHESRVDVAESKLDEALDRGEKWAILFALRSEAGRRRGWGEKTDRTQAETPLQPIQVVEIAIHPPRQLGERKEVPAVEVKPAPQPGSVAGAPAVSETA
jgi:hypothetical protein